MKPPRCLRFCAHTALLLASTLALTACAGRLNDDLAIGGTVELSTLSPADRIWLPPADYGAAPPSTTRGVSRANWDELVFSVPVDGVEHYATSSVQPLLADEMVRQGGGYPTESSCLQLGSDQSMGMQALEGLAGPFYSGLDILMAIPRAIIDPPWSVMRSPMDGYERAPHGPGYAAPSTTRVSPTAAPPPSGSPPPEPPIPTIPAAPPPRTAPGHVQP